MRRTVSDERPPRAFRRFRGKLIRAMRKARPVGTMRPMSPLLMLALADAIPLVEERGWALPSSATVAEAEHLLALGTPLGREAGGGARAPARAGAAAGPGAGGAGAARRRHRLRVGGRLRGLAHALGRR